MSARPDRQQTYVRRYLDARQTQAEPGSIGKGRQVRTLGILPAANSVTANTVGIDRAMSHRGHHRLSQVYRRPRRGNGGAARAGRARLVGVDMRLDRWSGAGQPGNRADPRSFSSAPSGEIGLLTDALAGLGRYCQVYVSGTRNGCIRYTDLPGFRPLLPA